MKNTQKKKKGGSVQELIGIRTITDYGIVTERGELLFYLAGHAHQHLRAVGIRH